jgi:hypothetical protein
MASKSRAHDVEEIAVRNSGVDVERYRKASKLLEKLREQGIVPRGYDLRSPYDQRALEDAPPTHRQLRRDAEDGTPI